MSQGNQHQGENQQNFPYHSQCKDYNLVSYTIPLGDMLLLHIVAQTDKGDKRKHNEDNFAIDPNTGTVVLCDGMGGHAKGEVASEMVCQNMIASSDISRDALEQAHRELFDYVSEHPEALGTGTTCVAARFVPTTDGGRAEYIHVGDSRMYVFDLKHERLQPLTTDHTHGAFLVRQRLRKQEMLTKEERAQIEQDHSAHYLYACIGGLEATTEVDYAESIDRWESMGVEPKTQALKPETVYLLCSDGLFSSPDGKTHNVTDANIERILTEDYRTYHKSLVYKESSFIESEVATSLIIAAKKAGGYDNITVILARLEDISVLYQRGLGEWEKGNPSIVVGLVEKYPSLFAAPKTTEGHLVAGEYAEYIDNKEAAYEHYAAAWEKKMHEIDRTYTSSFVRKAASVLTLFSFPWNSLFANVVSYSLKNLFSKSKKQGELPVLEVIAEEVADVERAETEESSREQPFSYNDGISAVIKGDTAALEQFISKYKIELERDDHAGNSQAAFLFAANAKKNGLPRIAMTQYEYALSRAGEEECLQPYIFFSREELLSLYATEYDHVGERSKQMEKLFLLREMKGVQATSLEEKIVSQIKETVHHAAQPLIKDNGQNLLETPAFMEFMELEEYKEKLPSLEDDFIEFYDLLIERATENKDSGLEVFLIKHLYNHYPPEKVQNIVARVTYNKARMQYELGDDTETILKTVFRFKPEEYKGGEGAVRLLIAKTYFKEGKKEEAMRELRTTLQTDDFSDNRYGVTRQNAEEVWKQYFSDTPIPQRGAKENGKKQKTMASIKTAIEQLSLLGNEAYTNANYEIAGKCMRAILSFDPSNQGAQRVLEMTTLESAYRQVTAANPPVPATATKEEVFMYRYEQAYKALEEEKTAAEKAAGEKQKRIKELEAALATLQTQNAEKRYTEQDVEEKVKGMYTQQQLDAALAATVAEMEQRYASQIAEKREASLETNVTAYERPEEQPEQRYPLRLIKPEEEQQDSRTEGKSFFQTFYEILSKYVGKSGTEEKQEKKVATSIPSEIPQTSPPLNYEAQLKQQLKNRRKQQL